MKVAKHKIFGAKTVKTKRKYKDAVNRIRQEIAELLRSMGAIGESEAAVLASWDMFDQNASSPFFDPEWMFDVKEGFDIVIGNPPYVFSRERISNNDKRTYRKLYTLTQFKINLYIIFFEKGMSLCNDSGILSYIIPNNWLSLEKNSDMRKYLLNNCCEINIVQNYQNVFENASVDTLILQCSKVGRHIVICKDWIDKKDVKITSINDADFYLQQRNYIIYNSAPSGCINFSNTTPLCSICEVKNGIQAYTVGEGTPICTEEIKNKRLYHSNIKHDSSWLRGLL